MFAIGSLAYSVAEFKKKVTSKAVPYWENNTNVVRRKLVRTHLLLQILHNNAVKSLAPRFWHIAVPHVPQSLAVQCSTHRASLLQC